MKRDKHTDFLINVGLSLFIVVIEYNSCNKTYIFLKIKKNKKIEKIKKIACILSCTVLE